MKKLLLVIFFLTNAIFCTPPETNIEYILEKSEDGTTRIVQKTYKTSEYVETLDEKNIPHDYELQKETLTECTLRFAKKYNRILVETLGLTIGKTIERNLKDEDGNYIELSDWDMEELGMNVFIYNKVLTIVLSLDTILAIPDLYHDLKEGRKLKLVRKKKS